VEFLDSVFFFDPVLQLGDRTGSVVAQKGRGWNDVLHAPELYLSRRRKPTEPAYTLGSHIVLETSKQLLLALDREEQAGH
jgi:hypothetical protein